MWEGDEGLDWVCVTYGDTRGAQLTGYVGEGDGGLTGYVGG